MSLRSTRLEKLLNTTSLRARNPEAACELCVICYEEVTEENEADLHCMHSKNLHMSCWHQLLLRGNANCPVCKTFPNIIHKDEYEQNYENAIEESEWILKRKIFFGAVNRKDKSIYSYQVQKDIKDYKKKLLKIDDSIKALKEELKKDRQFCNEIKSAIEKQHKFIKITTNCVRQTKLEKLTYQKQRLIKTYVCKVSHALSDKYVT